jgi:hypothetical protein
LNRISRQPNVKAFFVSISDLGDGVKPQGRLICSTQLICSTRQRAKFSFG